MMVGVSTFMLVNTVIAGWRENANSSSRIFFSQAIKKHHRFSYRAFQSFLPIYFIRNVPYLRSWLPFYRPCSFASQTFIWFADFLIIAFKLMQKNWFYYTIALYCTQEKHYRFNARKQKKNSRYIYSNCSSTSEVHAALILLFPAHLYSGRSISLELLSVFLSDSLNYLPEKTVIMSRPKLYIFFKCDQRRQVFLRHDSSQ